MNVLVACEFSGTVRDAFRRRGHEAWSCDILGPDDAPDDWAAQEYGNYHLEGDVRWFLDAAPGGNPWDLMIAHPPCTYLCNSGVRWLHTQEGRSAKMLEGAAFFRELIEADIPRIAIENPIPHKYAVAAIGSTYTQLIQPWQFGHGETKAICLWLKNLPPLKHTNVVSGREARVHRASPGPDRWKERSKFFRGVADAMADQW